MSDALLQVNDLRVYYGTDAGEVKAVDGVTFSVDRGFFDTPFTVTLAR